MCSFKKEGVQFLLLFVLICNYSLVHAQTFDFTHPQEQNFEKGLMALKNGDSLTAYQYIQTAYHLPHQQQELDYYYHVLSLSLDKPKANEHAVVWLKLTNNKIYQSLF
jgi:hypothetical protein